MRKLAAGLAVVLATGCTMPLTKTAAYSQNGLPAAEFEKQAADCEVTANLAFRDIPTYNATLDACMRSKGFKKL